MFQVFVSYIAVGRYVVLLLPAVFFLNFGDFKGSFAVMIQLHLCSRWILVSLRPFWLHPNALPGVISKMFPAVVPFLKEEPQSLVCWLATSFKVSSKGHRQRWEKGKRRKMTPEKENYSAFKTYRLDMFALVSFVPIVTCWIPNNDGK